jgi:hypothetical protein
MKSLVNFFKKFKKQRKSPIGRHRHPHNIRRKPFATAEILTTGEILLQLTPRDMNSDPEGAPESNEGR